MRRITVIVPELLGEPSVLRQKLPPLEQMAEMGRLFSLAPLPSVEAVEALYLGMSPAEGQLRQGPLTVAWLGADPPERSTHFHLSLMSFSDGAASEIRFQIDPQEKGAVMGLAKKLNTKLLTVVEGPGLDHGLVWESLGDLKTVSAADVDGKPIRGNLPEGDAEIALRRFIDDSINLMSETELNERRMDQDLPPLNLLWPWGEGVRTPVPNLALRRGEPALVMSCSARLAGLTRLSGYRHSDVAEFGRGTNVRLPDIAQQAQREDVSIVVLDQVAGFREAGKLDEADWLTREIATTLLQPLFDQALRTPTRITFLAPGKEPGLAVTFETGNRSSNTTPFDERALEERTLPRTQLHEAVAASLV